ncbi:MAG: choice-of-anchor D domain-containing protein, partial [Candidatus Krumholzibacteriota bacterium]|nr:choice-of-anchor D domain-containing protein [Candidatus Krumholzibacteriota bacterium]
MNQGQTAVRHIRLSNTGESDLVWSTDIETDLMGESLEGVRILVDRSHGQGDSFGAAIKSLEDRGATVVGNYQQLSEQVLKNYDALVLSGAKTDLSEETIHGIGEWVRRGGGLLLEVYAETTRHIGNQLLAEMGSDTRINLLSYYAGWVRRVDIDPLTSGVTSLYTSSATVSMIKRAPFVSLARHWNNGADYAALRGSVGAGRVVVLVGELTSEESLSKPAADNVRFLSNIVDWLSPEVRWLRTHPDNGTLAPNEHADISIDFDSTVEPGKYDALVVIHSNDPRRSRIGLSVGMQVQPAPAMEISSMNVAFGNVSTGSASSSVIEIVNKGSETLGVSPGSPTGRRFKIDPGPITVLPGEQFNLTVRFSPDVAGEYDGALELRSNDPDLPAVTIRLSGAGVDNTLLAVHVPTMSDTVLNGPVTIHNINLTNNGLGQLEFSANTTSHKDESAPDARVRILFDRSHGLPSSIGCSSLIGDLASRGMDVSENFEKITPELLSQYDILWMQGSVRYWNDTNEIVALSEWVISGGAVLMAEGRLYAVWFNHLLAAMGVQIECGYLEGIEGTPGLTTNIFDHQMTAGVSSIQLIRNTAGLVVSTPASVLISDVAGLPNSAYAEPGAGRVVVCTDHLFRNDRMDDNDARRFANQVFGWLADNARWLSVTPREGSIRPGATVTLEVLAQSSGLRTGAHAGTIEITHIAPDESQVTLPVSLHIDPAPAIVVPRTLPFGDIVLGTARSLPLFIINKGGKVLAVTDVQSSSPEITIEGPTSFFLLRDQSERLTVTFLPTARAEYSGSITIDSSDPDNPGSIIEVVGRAYEPPVLSVDPSMIHSIVEPGGTRESYFTVTNLGDIAASWTIMKGWPRTVTRDGVTLLGLDNVTVVYEESNGQNWMSDHWSSVKRGLTRRGANTEGGNADLSSSKLADANVLWLTDGDQPYKPEETEALLEWVRAGGGLLLEGDNPEMLPEYNLILSALETDIRYEAVPGGSGVTTNVVAHETTRGVARLRLEANIARL